MHHGDESEHVGEQPGGGLDPDGSGVPADQITRDGGVPADPLDGSNATGGYGDESTGLSDEAEADRATEAPR